MLQPGFRRSFLGQFQRVGGTGVLAQPAKHAAAQVVGEVGDFLAASLLVALARDDAGWLTAEY